MAHYQSDEKLTEDLRIKLDPTMRKWLEAEAKRQGRSLGQTVRELIRKEMDSHSEYLTKKEDRNKIL